MPDENDKPTSGPDKAPEFEGEFDADRAKRAIANLRAELATVKAERDSIRQSHETFKAAAEKSGEDRDKALADALRQLAIAKHKIPADVAEDFSDYLTGTPDEVEKRAAKLAARLGLDKPAEEPKPDADKGDDKGDETPAPPALPKRELAPGHDSEPEPEFDAAAIAKAALGLR